MDITKQKLVTVKNALQYAMLFAKTEEETAEFTLLLTDVQKAIFKEQEQSKYVESLKSLDGCPFKYCDNNPMCYGKCRYNNEN